MNNSSLHFKGLPLFAKGCCATVIQTVVNNQ